MSDSPDLPGNTANIPAGWYQDPQGAMRWWDGTQWGQAAPPAQMAAQPYAAMQTLDPGAAFSYGWKKFREYPGEFISLVLVVGLVSMIGVVVAIFALIPTFSSSSTAAVLGMIGYMLALLVSMAVSFVVQAGIYRAGLGVTRGVAPSLGMLVERTNLGTYIGTVLLVALASTIGLFLCILPGLAVLVFCAYAPLIALDKGLGPVDSIRRSVELVRDNLGQVLILLLLAYAVYYLGSLACYVGLLVSIPVALVMVTYSYRVLEGETLTP